MMENINKNLQSNEDFTSTLSDPTQYVFLVFAISYLQFPSWGKNTCLAWLEASFPTWEALVSEFLSLGHGDYLREGLSTKRSVGTKETVIQNFCLSYGDQSSCMGLKKWRSEDREQTYHGYTVSAMDQTVSAALRICSNIPIKIFNTEVLMLLINIC